jgi:hypothetical protein
MDQPPMAPSCALDEPGLLAQRERYRRAGRGARIVRRTRRRVVVDLGASVDTNDVDELIAVERECCPFFELQWAPELRRLSVSVSRAEHEPAIDAILHALDVHQAANGAPGSSTAAAGSPAGATTLGEADALTGADAAARCC